ncbi:acetate/propionate family kinase [Liquorilactobacillus sicerae]|uniref:acetate/propionate family kinase n=1 Tax=Liquorilactobacillus sicerae TaxID=1416943 RepID=UPI0024807E33|nr:acetate kinase [Liquorilactobacillus sicerae]
MVKILAVNAGSSSLKWKLFEMPQKQILAAGLIERIGMKKSEFSFSVANKKYREQLKIPDHKAAVDCLLEILTKYRIVEKLTEIKGVGHRFVNGGSFFSKSVIIDEANLNLMEQVKELAPLHNPGNILAIKAFQQELPAAVSVAVFDTGFHQTLPPENYLYSLPYQYFKKYHVRRFGAHGISYRYVFNRLLELTGQPSVRSNAIIMHLGSGASICAIKNGKSFDTTMGFSPVSGITMQTRSGDVDASLLVYLQEKLQISPQQMLDILNQKSGLLGISQISSDLRDILAKVNSDPQAKLAIKIFVNRIIKYLGAYITELGQVDNLVFTGGIGENVPVIRQLICDQLGLFGVKLAEEKNSAIGQITKISQASSQIAVWVIPTNEELMIAEDVFKLGGFN